MPEQHVIGSGLSEQELQLASFWVRHRINLRQIGYGSLIGFSVLTWGFVLWSLLDAYAISYPREARIPRIVTNNQLTIAGLQSAAPEPVRTSEVSVFDTTEARQDFLVELTNPNEQWAARFTYRFNVGGSLTPERKGFILPNSQRYLTELGYTPEAPARTARVVIENVEWQRVNPSDVERNYEEFAERRLKFFFEDVTFANDATIGDQTVGRTSFTFVNGSAYGYWDVDLTVVLFRGTVPAAVTTITAEEVRPGERRPMEINWFDRPTGITQTEITASVDILDSNAYLPTERF